ncbi:hypothetical protein B0H11DRAFT_2260523 [Mycena galericulata]|nr:hypothetical protein B0H11DRAFT_2260523 [Mycena galericulata]
MQNTNQPPAPHLATSPPAAARPTPPPAPLSTHAMRPPQHHSYARAFFFVFSFSDFLYRSFTVCVGHSIISSSSSFVPLTEPSTPLASNDSIPPLRCLFSFVATTSPSPPPAPPPSHSFVLPPPLALYPLPPSSYTQLTPSSPPSNGNETALSRGSLRHGRVEVRAKMPQGDWVSFVFLNPHITFHIRRSSLPPARSFLAAACSPRPLPLPLSSPSFFPSRSSPLPPSPPPCFTFFFAPLPLPC